MTAADIITIAVILLIMGIAIFHIVKSKKNGIKCIGCPDAPTCSHAGSRQSGQTSTCNGSCQSCSGGCHTHNNDN